MKAFWKILGAAALVGTLTPYKVEKHPETGEQTYQAVLWKAVSRPDPENGAKRQLSIDLGFTNPFHPASQEAHLFADELTVTYHPAGEREAAGDTPAEDGCETAPAREAPAGAPVEDAGQAPAEDAESQETAAPGGEAQA